MLFFSSLSSPCIIPFRIISYYCYRRRRVIQWRTWHRRITLSSRWCCTYIFLYNAALGVLCASSPRRTAEFGRLSQRRLTYGALPVVRLTGTKHPLVPDPSRRNLPVNNNNNNNTTSRYIIVVVRVYCNAGWAARYCRGSRMSI